MPIFASLVLLKYAPLIVMDFTAAVHFVDSKVKPNMPALPAEPNFTPFGVLP